MTDLRDRLNRLNAVRATMTTHTPRPVRSTYPAAPMMASYPPLEGPPQPLETLLPGDVFDSALGVTYIIPTRHAPNHVHGGRRLAEWLDQDLTGAALFSRDPRLAGIDPRRCLFLDTETTGLSAGAGTLVFLIGIGLFTDNGFEIRQFFLRDPAHEAAMLDTLHALLRQFDALVTFNGRSFDVPLLASRYVLNRQRVLLDQWPHLDLLHPARRLWKRRLESCRLSALETAILGVERTGEDVPGFLIPQMYQDYVRTGDARQMQRVVYHNLYDVLSMVTLAAHLCETFAQPDAADLPCDDLISLARWYDSLGKVDPAESAYTAALTAARRDSDKAAALEGLAALLKRRERHDAAAACWQSLAEMQPSALTPRLELAKYYEWHSGDLERARQWTHDALRIVRGWGFSRQRETTLAELTHRLERLDAKR